MVEENAAGNNLVLRNMTANQTIHIPTGNCLANPTLQPDVLRGANAEARPAARSLKRCGSLIAGILHGSLNPTCEPAAFLANFATKDPGTQTTWNSMMMIPNDILNSATGIPESTIALLKSTYPLVTPPGTGNLSQNRLQKQK